MNVPAPFAATFTVPVDTLQLVPVIAVGSLHASETLPANPPLESISRLYVAVPPAVTVCAKLPPAGGAISKSMAVPVRLTVCGEPGALSVIVIVAHRAPAVAPHGGLCCSGLNTMLTEHVCPGATVIPPAPVHDCPVGFVPPDAGTQLPVPLFATQKSPVSPPMKEISLTASGPVPLLVNVTVCAALGVPTNCAAENATLIADNFTPACVPVPLKAAVCGLPLALSATLNVALRLPVAVGENVT
jgi:hypothetical protein